MVYGIQIKTTFVLMLLPLLAGLASYAPCDGAQVGLNEPTLLQSFPGWVKGLALSPDGKTVAWCEGGGVTSGIGIWDVASGKQKVFFEGKHGEVALSTDGKLLAFGDDLGRIKFWDLASEKCIADFRGHPRAVGRLAFSPDGRFLATSTQDSTNAEETLALWDVKTRDNATNFKGQTSTILTLAFSPDGKLLASAGVDGGKIKLWHVATGKLASVIQEDPKPFIQSMSFDPTGKILAVAFHIPGKKSPKPISTGIGGRPDWDVKLWDVATGQVAESLKGHKGVVRAVAFSPKGGFLASSGDKPLRIWDVAASREVASLPMATWNLAFSSDGRTLAAAGGVGKKVVKVWSLP